MRSFVDFNGLTPGDIISRLFLWFFGPAFVALFIRELSSWSSIVGEACVGAVVWWDASRARRPRPLVDAAIALIPLAGWWWYGRARGIDILSRDHNATADGVERPAGTNVDRPGARIWNPRWSRKFDIVTPLSPEASLQALRAVTLAWWSPIGAFASEAGRPLPWHLLHGGARSHRPERSGHPSLGDRRTKRLDELQSPGRSDLSRDLDVARVGGGRHRGRGQGRRWIPHSVSRHRPSCD